MDNLIGAQILTATHVPVDNKASPGQCSVLPDASAGVQCLPPLPHPHTLYLGIVNHLPALSSPVHHYVTTPEGSGSESDVVESGIL